MAMSRWTSSDVLAAVGSCGVVELEMREGWWCRVVVGVRRG